MLLLAEQSYRHLPDEIEVARRWWHLPLDTLLPLDTGETYQLLFSGRPGGSKGPDIRDAVLRPLASSSPLAPAGLRQVLQAPRLCGNVEFHVRASDWYNHHHESDRRYNQVILHIVLRYDITQPILRQDGLSIPTCTLADLPAEEQALQLLGAGLPPWPCQEIIPALTESERQQLLHRAGLLRFEQKSELFSTQLRALSTHKHDDETLYDHYLLPALGEGLAYGRDRAFFRATSLRLMGIPGILPEPEGRATRPAPLDAQRLRALRHLIEQAQITPLWQRLRTILTPGEAHGSLPSIWPLRRIFTRLNLSLARTDILICNVVLPFAAAVALREQDIVLYECARQLYTSYPDLPSNQVTRMMSAQLQLSGEPGGACQQQGLHYIYQQTCRTKECTQWSAGRKAL
ncbi:DUF2851 family protein [Ktedonobacter robiniae]|uniref:DUF2851 domain-containing protein n=1 Tax=Ktedonobacter robiniae TaxID=2778365 RepID=A0ABQ3UJK4_9CHLR|nr:DUF2851 family protein [Ktedonobacter robiniae]GHO52868.1 hypothetical protein KSB_13430 [Ktedonobacter robiniae]